MRAAQSAGRLAAALLSLSTLSSAWPNWLPALDSLVVRDDAPASENSTSKQASAPISTNLNTAGRTSTADSKTTTTDASKATVTSIGDDKKTTTFTGTANKTGTASANHTTFDATNPAGNVVMTKPAATDGTQLYKIDDLLTFGWNYTNLLATPTAVDVLLSCSTASATWTLTANMTFDSQATYTWDTKQFQSDHPERQLPIAEYTLLIFDAESNPTATADAGYLSPFNGLKFGMYTPRPSVALGDWTCATCSAAMSGMERRGLGAAIIMSLVTIFSFTWFVTGFAGVVL